MLTKQKKKTSRAFIYLKIALLLTSMGSSLSTGKLKIAMYWASAFSNSQKLFKWVICLMISHVSHEIPIKRRSYQVTSAQLDGSFSSSRFRISAKH